jgi:hypothetical protein
MLVDADNVRSTKRSPGLPIGRAAKLAFDLDAARAACCLSAAVLLSKKTVDQAELEECTRLDDSLARAHRLLKSTIREIMLSRLTRRSRRSRAR